MSDLSILFEPVKLGPITLPNRWAMAPMTRQFSPNRTPTEDVARYYQRRAERGHGAHHHGRHDPSGSRLQRQRRHPRHQRRGPRGRLGQGRGGRTRRRQQDLPADLAYGRDARCRGLGAS